MIEIVPLEGVGEVEAGTDLGAALAQVARPLPLRDRDVVVVTQKVVSKAEGRLVPADTKAEAVASESARILRRVREMVIAETKHGFVCANAGVDGSNVPLGQVALLPLDPDLSARRLRSRFKHLLEVDVGVVVSDTFGRAWRLGQTDVAIGVAGFLPFNDHIGSLDAEGREMTATRICVADELAAAAEMAMGKTKRICAAVIRGADVTWGRGAATQIVRSYSGDLFR